LTCDIRLLLGPLACRSAVSAAPSKLICAAAYSSVPGGRVPRNAPRAFDTPRAPPVPASARGAASLSPPMNWLAPSRQSNRIKVMKSAWCSRSRRPGWRRARWTGLGAGTC